MRWLMSHTCECVDVGCVKTHAFRVRERVREGGRAERVIRGETAVGEQMLDKLTTNHNVIVMSVAREA